MISRQNVLGLAVVLLGAAALVSPQPAAAEQMVGECARCVDLGSCSQAEWLCGNWNCGVPTGSVCGDLGTCNAAAGKMLVSCTMNEQ